MHRRRGVTLVELMIVVCIISILAALAISTWRWVVRVCREVERHTILDSMMVSIKSYGADETLDGSWWPDEAPGKLSRGEGRSVDLGIGVIRLDGPAWCSYIPRVTDAWGAAVAVCDSDGDGYYTVEVDSVKLLPNDVAYSGGGEATASCDVGLVPDAITIVTEFASGAIASPAKLCNRLQSRADAART